MPELNDVTVNVKTNTDNIVKVARAIAEHLDSLAYELEAIAEGMVVFASVWKRFREDFNKMDQNFHRDFHNKWDRW